MAASEFLSRIQSGAVLVSDGATGTNLQARGLPRGVAAETWVLERPEEIRALHQDFLAAGSDLILTCTFGANRLRLEGAGLAGRVAEVNQRAVELARSAGAALVAGSLGPTGLLLQPMGPLSEAQAEEAYAEQAQALDAAGVDLLVLETQFDINEAAAGARAIRSVSRLPLVVSFSFDRGVRTMMGVRPAQAAELAESAGADLLGLNCGRSLEDNLRALGEARAATRLPIWFKPNAGLPAVDEAGTAVYSVTPEQMGRLAPEWLAAGAQVVGGCCGTSPQHLAAIAQAAHSVSPAQ